MVTLLAVALVLESLAGLLVLGLLWYCVREDVARERARGVSTAAIVLPPAPLTLSERHALETDRVH